MLYYFLLLRKVSY